MLLLLNGSIPHLCILLPPGAQLLADEGQALHHVAGAQRSIGSCSRGSPQHGTQLALQGACYAWCAHGTVAAAEGGGVAQVGQGWGVGEALEDAVKVTGLAQVLEAVAYPLAAGPGGTQLLVLLLVVVVRCALQANQ
jgi:hypothetical protein